MDRRTALLSRAGLRELTFLAVRSKTRFAVGAALFRLRLQRLDFNFVPKRGRGQRDDMRANRTVATRPPKETRTSTFRPWRRRLSSASSAISDGTGSVERASSVARYSPSTRSTTGGRPRSPSGRSPGAYVPVFSAGVRSSKRTSISVPTGSAEGRLTTPCSTRLGFPSGVMLMCSQPLPASSRPSAPTQTRTRNFMIDWFGGRTPARPRHEH